MTDENTRLPSDSVVEAAEVLDSALGGMLTFYGMDEEKGEVSGVVHEAARKARERYAEALAAQPRDDVRELLGYARAIVDSVRIFIGSEYRDERLEPEGEWLAKEAREPHADLCKLTARIDTALSQGDEQPDTGPSVEAMVETYQQTHEVARELGYPSLTEALEHLAELKEQPDTDGLAGENAYGMGRPLIVGDPVVHRNKPFWSLGVVQSVSDETGVITCQWWADHGYFQAGSNPKELVHAANVFRALRTDRKAVLEEAAEWFEAQWRPMLGGRIYVGPATREIPDAIRALAEEPAQ